MDAIIGANQEGAILTLTEKATNFLIMTKLKNGKNAVCLKDQLISISLPYKNNMLTITTDNGPRIC